MARSSSTSRNPASPRPRRTMLDGQLAIRAAIVNHRTDETAISTRWWRRCWSSARGGPARSDRGRGAAAGGAVTRNAVQTTTAPEMIRGRCRSGRLMRADQAAELTSPLGCVGVVLVLQLLFIGDQLAGILQRPVEIAAHDVVVDALDDRPGARHRRDDVAHQVEIGAVLGSADPARCT